MARSGLSRTALRASWFGLLLLMALTVLLTSCVSPPRAAPPTSAVPAAYATAAAALAYTHPRDASPDHPWSSAG